MKQKLSATVQFPDGKANCQEIKDSHQPAKQAKSPPPPPPPPNQTGIKNTTNNTKMHTTRIHFSNTSGKTAKGKSFNLLLAPETDATHHTGQRRSAESLTHRHTVVWAQGQPCSSCCRHTLGCHSTDCLVQGLSDTASQRYS